MFLINWSLCGSLISSDNLLIIIMLVCVINLRYTKWQKHIHKVNVCSSRVEKVNILERFLGVTQTWMDHHQSKCSDLRCSLSKGVHHHTLQFLLFFTAAHGEVSCEVVHFYFFWLMCQCYSWVCVLLPWVSKYSHGCHPEKRKHLSKINTYSYKYKILYSLHKCFCCYLSVPILSVTTGCVSFFSRSHMWMLEAASRTQKTVGLVCVHCRETTASPAVPFFHSATGCSWLTACSLMLPFPQPTWNMGKQISLWTKHVNVFFFQSHCKLN